MNSIQRLIQIFVRFLQYVSPVYARKIGLHLWATPVRFKRPPREEAYLKKMRVEKLNVDFKNALIYDESYGRGKTLTRGFYDDSAKKYIMTYHQGAGPLILLVHGWSGRATQMGAIAESLVNEGYGILAFDGFAHGDSPGKQTSMLEFVYLIQLLAQEYGPFEGIVGHSMGGIAAGMAISKGVKADHLVTLGSPATFEFITRNYMENIRANEETLKFIVDFTLKYTKSTAADFELVTAVKKLDIPGLIVHDRDDTEVEYRQALILKEAWPAADLFTTEKLGHRRILWDVKVLRKISSFLSEKKVTL
ncbi:MAG TPA: alpha/beta hydrolase [Caldithrix abyssi]|uniref:Alpha/beta hydrolase n=1 Tax=Caldithrix abyssi TaxID=187145 RepID=A0A7V1LJP6_CALAY|nr:alpha/beta hydrolase [Caldithrix abyssi]